MLSLRLWGLYKLMEGKIRSFLNLTMDLLTPLPISTLRGSKSDMIFWLDKEDTIYRLQTIYSLE